MKSSGSNQTNSFKRTRNLFDPHSLSPYRLSRSRLENFLNCPRCFYLDRRLGIEPPGMPAFSLNVAVDELLKKEFDAFRRLQQIPPLLKANGIHALPLAHPLMDEWRHPFTGIPYHHRPTNVILYGAVDDIWVDDKGQSFVVEYKSTATDKAISLDTEYRQAYKRQMEIYQWLLRKQKLNISDTGYFVYCNADKSKKSFDAKLEFKIQIIVYQGNDRWVEEALVDSHRCLMQEKPPDYTPNCPYCRYLRGATPLSLPQETLPQPLKETLRAQTPLQGELF
jgi:CRISPR/Cas system-associated exonuclease Cas4 (RecB family)